MAIRHIITIQVAPGRAADFADAFKPLKAAAQQEEGCEQYDLFQNLDAPDTLLMLERWTSQALLDEHTHRERTTNAALIEALIALWAPGTTPKLERYED
ncbi:putative quinol monooxygenase [Nocardia yunnanensis]|nr:antibiotic biosynthesis monooxygenase family protein [Nocardia yunnanensis]